MRSIRPALCAVCLVIGLIDSASAMTLTNAGKLEETVSASPLRVRYGHHGGWHGGGHHGHHRGWGHHHHGGWGWPLALGLAAPFFAGGGCYY